MGRFRRDTDRIPTHFSGRVIPLQNESSNLDVLSSFAGPKFISSWHQKCTTDFNRRLDTSTKLLRISVCDAKPRYYRHTVTNLGMIVFGSYMYIEEYEESALWHPSSS
jgi:hypothetical protein